MIFWEHFVITCEKKEPEPPKNPESPPGDVRATCRQLRPLGRYFATLVAGGSVWGVARLLNANRYVMWSGALISALVTYSQIVRFFDTTIQRTPLELVVRYGQIQVVRRDNAFVLEVSGDSGTYFTVKTSGRGQLVDVPGRHSVRNLWLGSDQMPLLVGPKQQNWVETNQYKA
jgi:hypothetical protein